MKLTLFWGAIGHFALIAAQVCLMLHFARAWLTTEDIDAIRGGLLLLQALFGMTQHVANPITGAIDTAAIVPALAGKTP